MNTPLTDEQIEKALEELPGWSYEDGKLRRAYYFGSFKEALSFVVRIGMHAEEQQHHPEIFNVYGTVKIALHTHDAGGKVTGLDVKLAKTIERVNWT